MTEYEHTGPAYRRISPERYANDTRAVVQMLSDAILASPDGNPWFSELEAARYRDLRAKEDTILEAEAIVRTGSAALTFSQQ